MIIKEAEFRFSPSSNNLIILQGGNGEGKSAVFDAIAFALLGRRRGNSVKNYINREEENFSIEIILRKREVEDPYFIKIFCAHKQMPPVKKEISHKGFTYKNSEYDTFVKKEFDLDLIENIVFTLQDDNSITRFKPAQLRDMLKQVFHLSFDAEYLTISQISKQLQEKEQTLRASINSYMHSLDILKKDLVLLSRPPSHTLLTAKKKEKENLEKEFKALSNRFQTWNNSLKQLDFEIEKIEKQLRYLKTTKEEFLKDKTILENRYKEQESLLKQLEEERKSIEKNLRPEEFLKENQEKLSQQEKQLFEIEMDLRELYDKKKLLEQDTCPTCHQPLPEDWIKNKDIFNISIKEKEGLKNKIIKEIENIKKDLKNQKTLISQKESIDNKIEQALSYKNNIESQLELKKSSLWIEETEKEWEENKNLLSKKIKEKENVLKEFNINE
jgi:DNA repair exonuclease SbcCD ATPase subunit